MDSHTIHFTQRPTKIEKKIPLPYSIPEDDNSKTKADYANGVLKIRIPISNMTNVKSLKKATFDLKESSLTVFSKIN